MVFDAFAVSLLPHLQVTQKTRRNYSGAYQRHLFRPLGDKNIEEITKFDLIEALQALPPQTRYQTLMVARVLFREALNRELVEDSPAARIKAPKITVDSAKFLIWEDLREIDFGSQTTRIRFLALHGLRYGEAAALTGEDIYDDRVHITKSIHGKTKSIAGVRTVPQMSEFQPFVKYQNTIAARLKPYGVTVHSLRKTYAYMLKSADVHVTTASKLMGHSNPLITMKIYTAVLDNEIEKSGAALNLLMNRPNPRMNSRS
jgi:integrase